MKLVYVGPHDAVDVLNVHAERDGEPVELPDEIGKGLVERGDFKKAAAGRSTTTPPAVGPEKE
jgi:hypothetical protein